MPLAAAVGIVVVVLLLASIGTGQWLELRRHLPRSWPWIPATAAAWCLGLGAFFAIAPPLWQEGQPLAVGLLGALAMAVTMAAVTGWAALTLLKVQAVAGGLADGGLADGGLGAGVPRGGRREPKRR